MKLKGFTLAEVLITLTIVGVVAAITIPSVIANSQQQEYKTGLKKAVSVLNSAITMTKTMTNESPYDNGDLFNYIQQEMSIIKKVDSDTSTKIVDGTSFTLGKNRAFYTTDGMRFEVSHDGTTKRLKLHESDNSASNLKVVRIPHGSRNVAGFCGSYGLAENPNNTTNTPCIILVDVNGDRKPTAYGTNVTVSEESKSTTPNYKYPSVNDKRLMDVFNILITEDKAIPYGVVAQRAMYNAK